MQPQTAVLDVGQYRGPMAAPDSRSQIKFRRGKTCHPAHNSNPTSLTLRNPPAPEPKPANTALASTPIVTVSPARSISSPSTSTKPSSNTAPAFANLSNPSALEIELARSIAEDHWRLKRARAIETGIFALGQQGALGSLATNAREDPAQLPIDEAISQARTWLAKSENFQLLALYEQRIRRAIEKNMAEFRTLRAERQAARKQALEEAQLLAQLAHSKGEEYNPASDFPPELIQIGSDFSSAGLTRLINRNQRLTEAHHCAKTKWGRPSACQAAGSGTSAAA